MKSADDFKIKMILGLFTVDQGRLKVFLLKKAGEPYKGYWHLPSKPLYYEETLEDNQNILLKDYAGLEDAYIENFRAFSDKEKFLTDKVVHITMIGITDIASATYKKMDLSEKESDWFYVDSLPKLAYNHEEIVCEMTVYLKRRLQETDMIRRLFPSDFTLPELQIFSEQLLNKTLDRRNFRKKILSLNILEDTGDKSESVSGRPAKLYKFKENIEKIDLFK